MGMNDNRYPASNRDIVIVLEASGVCNQGKGAWDETDFRDCEDDYSEQAEREYQIDLADRAKLLQ